VVHRSRNRTWGPWRYNLFRPPERPLVTERVSGDRVTYPCLRVATRSPSPC